MYFIWINLPPLDPSLAVSSKDNPICECIPFALKISGKKTNEDSSYITKLGSLIDQELSPDPLEENDVNLRNVEENFKINLEVWEKRQISTYEKSYTCIYKGTRYENSLKFHYVDGWGKLIFIVNEKS